jgi:hypothetical protein
MLIAQLWDAAWVWQTSFPARHILRACQAFHRTPNNNPLDSTGRLIFFF